MRFCVIFYYFDVFLTFLYGVGVKFLYTFPYTCSETCTFRVDYRNVFTVGISTQRLTKQALIT